ncbi:Serine carboxypeptidase-like 4 [Sesamum angolense]|uniref:Serine carboxypeptidase-like 4 n=1 Tax=Sesamum angolense TaxID=2727404 RepID=A0AAE1T5V4_9LAMI|nr:Serine carboxypeptidase-like 4 [Sesamum angolense]
MWARSQLSSGYDIVSHPWCEDSSAKKQDVLSWYMPFEENSINFLQPNDNLRLTYIWANDKSAQKALNVREGTIKQWVRCNQSISHSTPGPSGIIPYIQNVKRTVGYHQKFTNKSTRVLIFRYTMQYAQGDYELTYATVKGGGHTNPEHRPKESFIMFERWIREKAL